MIENYDLIRCNSNSRHTGGVIIYIDKSLNWNLIDSTSKSRTWILSISINDSSINGRFVLVYKSPKEKINDFLEIIDDYLERVLISDKRIVILGDMNINLSKKTKNGKKYLKVLEQYSLKQFINEPTRETNKSQTIIDHLISNDDNISWKIEKDSVTDHHMILVDLNKSPNLCKMLPKKSVVSWKNYSKEKLVELIEELEYMPNSNVNDIAGGLVESLKHCINNLIIKREVKSRPSIWFNNEIKEIKDKLKILREKVNLTHAAEDQNQLRFYNKIYRDEIKKAKSDYVRQTIEKNIENPKQLWKSLKGLYESNDCQIKSIIINGNMLNDEQRIANEMNVSFIKSVEAIVSNISKPKLINYNDKIIIPSNACFTIKRITENDLIRITKELKHKSFTDNLSGKVINDALSSEKFRNELLYLINTSIESSSMPDVFKISSVTPIPKVSSPQCPDDFRPINNLPVIEKIIESVVHEQLTEYLYEYDILCPQQSGFRKFHSTETAILTVIHDWIEGIEKKNKIVSVFLDFRKAFETVDRDNLMIKMKKYGFSEHAIKWFKSFLSDRYQVTKINNTMSLKQKVCIGLPQGSKLANLLFILYINDLHLNLKNTKLSLFADDSAVYIEEKELITAERKLNEDLEHINDWLKFNSLAINVSKCHGMILNRKNESINLVINGNRIQIVDTVKYLGVIVDCNLKFEGHIEKIKTRINQRTALLRRLNDKMNYKSKVLFLKSNILPIYDYCSSILMMVDDTRVKMIQRCINKALRIVLSVPIQTHLDEMLDRLKILSVKDRILLNSLKLINRTTTRGAPLTLESKFKKRKNVIDRILRSNEEFSLPKWKLKISQSTIFYDGIKLFNHCKRNNCKDKNCMLKCKLFKSLKI